jgi:hypothetical protein
MFQFWHCLINRMTLHPVGPATADHSLSGTELPQPEQG